MVVTRLQNVYVTVQDVGAARHFYEGVLGLRLKFADSPRWVQYDFGGVGFSIASEAESAAPDKTVVIFEVDDLDDARQRILAYGGQVLSIRDMGSHGMVMSVADPEGGIFQLFCRATT